MSADRSSDSQDERDEFDKIVAGLELSLPDDLPPQPAERAEVFDPRMSDPVDEAEVEHFEPAPVPPGPVLSPSERLACAALVGGPALLLVATVIGWQLPRWLSGAIVLGFVAAMVLLIAHRGNHHRDDDPDHGAVL